MPMKLLYSSDGSNYVFAVGYCCLPCTFLLSAVQP